VQDTIIYLDPESGLNLQINTLLAVEHLHPVVVAIFVGAVISAIMSTSDSILLGCGTVISVNLLPRVVKDPSDQLRLRVARWHVGAVHARNLVAQTEYRGRLFGHLRRVHGLRSVELPVSGHTSELRRVLDLSRGCRGGLVADAKSEPAQTFDKCRWRANRTQGKAWHASFIPADYLKPCNSPLIQDPATTMTNAPRSRYGNGALP
jgi:hypothetical protein